MCVVQVQYSKGCRNSMIKAAICGFGGLGHLHANSLFGMEDVKMTAICDTDPKQLAKNEIQFNISSNQEDIDLNDLKTYLDLSDMLSNEKLDVIVVATPSNLHSELSIMALDAGCHVLCEKPMALSVEDCDRMIAARDRSGKQLMIGQCLRFWPEYEYLQACIEDGRFGNLLSLFAERIGTYHEGRWFDDGNLSGGAAMDLHVHDVDWVQMVLGRPDQIQAAGQIGVTGRCDDISAIWQYRDGALVTLRGSWMYSAFRMSFTAFFENGVVEYHPGGAGFKVTGPGYKPVEGIEISSESAYVREMKYFMDCARGAHANTRCSAESTRDGIALAIAEIAAANLA